ncbi:hypothetical protein [Aquimarina agarilytica]|uniref:hypothetical protein n=1 Tax=Aquimarina agarilytica TaxID=1087449 RepID=UPI000287D3FE|nr:hypothetical protein [Aquimarina agarilytica]
MKKTFKFLVLSIALLFSAVSFAQSVEFATPPKTYIPKAQSIPGYKIKYTATKPSTIYLGIKKDGKAIGNAIHKVAGAGTKTIDLSLWIWEGASQLSKKSNYTYTLSMWADPENVFEHLAAEAKPIDGVTLGKPKKKKKKKN